MMMTGSNTADMVISRELPMPPEHLVRVIHALLEGLVLQRILTPELFPDEVFFAAFEALAHHRGSVLGSLPSLPQPSQKRFETCIWHTLRGFDPERPILTQISRFDRLKDPLGVIQAYKLAKRYVDFQLVLAGGDVRMWKPEPYIFIHACERLNIAPTEAVYVGDNYFADVVGARRAGLLPVLYDPRGIFPDPGCPIIRSFPELTQLLKANGTVTTARRR